MATSYNGWYASPDLPIRPLVVAGESFIPGVLDDDDVYTVLRYVAVQMHERIEPIVRSDWHDADDWGYYYKVSTGDSSVLSCHASGTAIDYNATRHPYGVRTSANFSPGQIAEIRQILGEIDNVVRWGGEWNTPDAMHFEIWGTKAEVARVAYRLNHKEEEDEMKQEDFERIRSIVQDEIAKERDNLRSVVREEADASNDSLLAEQVEVTTSTGGKRTMSLKQLLRETWQRLAKHA